MPSHRVDRTSQNAIYPTGVSNVILASSSQFRLDSRRVYERREPGELGLLTIREGLTENGFDNVSVFVPPAEGLLDVETDRRAIMEQFKRMGAAQRGAVIGISTTTSEYSKFELLSRMIRENFPGARLIAGGAHFFRDHIDGVPDTLEVAFESGLADAVQVGHAQAFIDFVTKHDGDLEKADGPGFYRVDPLSGRIFGSGMGLYPKLTSLPIAYDQSSRSATVILKNSCIHSCAYCCARFGVASAFPADSAVVSLNRFFQSNDALFLNIGDSDPFENDDVEYYGEILGRLRWPFYMNAHLNPILLLDDAHQEKILGLIPYTVGKKFLLGRDAVTEEIAAKIGSNDHGRPKTQNQLDAERRGLMKFIRRLKESRTGGNPKLKTYLVVSYIISPFETMDSLRAMMDEIAALLDMNDDTVRIEIAGSPLMPFPGTPLRRRFRGSIDLGALDFYSVRSGISVPWKMGPDVTEFGLRLMSNVMDLYLDGGKQVALYLFGLAKGIINLDGTRREVSRPVHSAVEGETTQSVTGLADAGETSRVAESSGSSTTSQSRRRSRRASRSAGRTARAAVRSGVRMIAPSVALRPTTVRVP